MKTLIKKIIKIFLVGLTFVLPLAASALMQSLSYRIYETVLENFDGPVISTVASTAGETTATISWTTDVTADAFVIYDTDSGFANAKEQGSSAKVSTSQSVTLVGLEDATTYYFKVKSSNLLGGTRIDSTVRNFTTSATAVPPVTPPSTGGGGILIVDKRDKIAPALSNIRVTDIKSDSARVSWETDENANSFVEHGKTSGLGLTLGQWDEAKNHSVSLVNLEADMTYYYRVLSGDTSGNLASSTVATFKTLTLAEEIKQEQEATTTPAEEPSITDLSAALERARQIILELSSQVSIGVLQTNLTEHFNALDAINNLLPGPLFSAEPKVIIESRAATVIWLTNVDATSQVAYAAEKDYKAGTVEPYASVVGNTEKRTKDHEVKIVGLEPDTLYHYQLRSKGLVGSLTKTRDFTFRTNKEGLEIVSYSVKVISPQTVEFRWITNAETDSALRYIPIRNNVLAVDEAKSVSDEHMSLIHEMTVENLEGGMVYQIELSGKDMNGRVVSKIIEAFSTAEDNLPPEITQVRTDSVITPGKDYRVQVIISWQTNEPATSRVQFQKGIGSREGDLLEKLPLDSNYTKRHVSIIPKLEPGQVYSFKVESADSAGNAARSQLYSLLAPKKKETIFDIILRILEETFGWIGGIGK